MMKRVEVYNYEEAQLISQILSYPVLVEGEFDNGTLGGAIVIEDQEKFKHHVYYLFDMSNLKQVLIHYGNANKIYETLDEMGNLSSKFNYQFLQLNHHLNNFYDKYQNEYDEQISKRQMDYTKLKIDHNKILYKMTQITEHLNKVNEMWAEELNKMGGENND